MCAAPGPPRRRTVAPRLHVRHGRRQRLGRLRRRRLRPRGGGHAQRPARRRAGRRYPDRPAHRRNGGTPVSTPDTTLDARFSDAAATAAGWDETRRALEDAQLSWICTVRADGRPHLTPLVAVWLDGALYFSTGAGEQKAVNLRGNPHVLLLTGCHRWDDGLDVVAEGDAVQVTDEALLTRLAAEWADRKSTRLNSSHMSISYAVFCLKKKKKRKV